MALIGELPKFDNIGDDWQVYTERLEQFFEINDVQDDKKKALLISSISDETYKTLRDLCHPLLPKNKIYNDLIDILNKQFISKTSVFRERHHFYNAQQFPDETVLNWFARLKKLSIFCKFGEKFEDILLDKFVSGLHSMAILDRLCEEDSLTLRQAVDIAGVKESAGVGTFAVDITDNVSVFADGSQGDEEERNELRHRSRDEPNERPQMESHGREGGPNYLQSNRGWGHSRLNHHKNFDRKRKFCPRNDNKDGHRYHKRPCNNYNSSSRFRNN